MNDLIDNHASEHYPFSIFIRMVSVFVKNENCVKETQLLVPPGNRVHRPVRLVGMTALQCLTDFIFTSVSSGVSET